VRDFVGVHRHAFEHRFGLRQRLAGIRRVALRLAGFDQQGQHLGIAPALARGQQLPHQHVHARQAALRQRG
jgi:hypothetical protein